MAAFFNSIT